MDFMDTYLSMLTIIWILFVQATDASDQPNPAFADCAIGPQVLKIQA